MNPARKRRIVVFLDRALERFLAVPARCDDFPRLFHIPADPKGLPLPTKTWPMIPPRPKPPHRIAVRIYPWSSVDRLLDH